MRPEPKIGQKVRVKWGLRWYDATITKKPARDKWQVRYTDGRTRIVGRDEILLPGENEEDVEGLGGRLGRSGRLGRPGVDLPGAAIEEATASKSPAVESIPFDYTLTEVDLAAIRVVIASAEGWTPAVDPAPAVTFSSQPVSLTGAKAEFVDTPALSAHHSRALLTIVPCGFQRDQAPIRAVVIDLEKGTSTGPIRFPNESLPLAVSPSGKLIAARANGFGSGTMNRLDIWSVDGGKATHLISIEPFANAELTSYTDIDRVHFVDDTHLLTMNREGTTIVWEVTTAPEPSIKGLWCYQNSRHMRGKPALTPGGRYVLTREDGRIVAIDALTGTPTGLIKVPGFSDALGVTADGRQLLFFDVAGLKVWSMESGKLERQVTLPQKALNRARGTAMRPLRDGFMLIGPYVFDVSRGEFVWEHSWPTEFGMVSILANGHALVASDLQENPRFMAMALPHEKARQAAASLPPPAYAVQPGAKVSLDIQVEGTGEERQRIINALTAYLAESNITVADGQPVRLTARTTTGERKQQTFERHGVGGRVQETVTYTPRVTRLAWEKDGKTLWDQTWNSGVGFQLLVKDGQTAQEAADAQSRYSPLFLETAKPPVRVREYVEQLTSGASAITSNGIEDK